MSNRVAGRTLSRVGLGGEPAIGLLLLLIVAMAVAGAVALSAAASFSSKATRSELSASLYDDLRFGITNAELARHEVLTGDGQEEAVLSSLELIRASVNGLRSEVVAEHQDEFVELAANVLVYERAVSRPDALSGQVDSAAEEELDELASTLLEAVVGEQQEHRVEAVQERQTSTLVMRRLGLGLIFLFVVVLALALVAARTLHRRRRQLLEANDDAEHVSLHDPLTDLPNRRALRRSVDQALSTVTDSGKAPVLLWLDLDGFKEINDSVGHEVGDQVLTAVSQRLRSAVREPDMVARVGGDEFVVFCQDLPSTDRAVEVAERIAGIVAQPISLDNGIQFVTTSIGIAMAPAPDVGSLFAAADTAMYEAKRLGRGFVTVFDESLRTALTERMTLTRELSHATELGELRLNYQPVIELRTDEVVGVEALVRWQHPTRGLLAPAAFMQLAEQTGLISEIGAWVIEEACRTLARWSQNQPGGRPLLIAVNLAARQVSDPAIVRIIRDAFTATGVDPAMLKLEITESSIMVDVPRAIATLEELRQLGMKIAIDDFGTGYSSLTYLKQFPVHEIKLDKSFVDGVGSSADDSAIVAAVVNLADAVGLRVVAEGVETARQLSVLRTLGCDYGQGYLWAKPMPADAVERWLTARHRPVLSDPAPH